MSTDTTHELQRRRQLVIDELRPHGRRLAHHLQRHARSRVADSEGVQKLRHWVVEGVLMLPSNLAKATVSYKYLEGDPTYRARPSAGEAGRTAIGTEMTREARRMVRAARAALKRYGFEGAALTAEVARTVVAEVV